MRVVVERVSKVYADRAGHTLRALDGIDLVVDAEEFVAVLGPSGCGKSTLLNLIAGLLAPSEGAIWLDEPFSAVDAQTRQLMQEELLAIWERTRKTIVYVTHNIHEAVYMADRVVVLSRRPGRVLAEVKVELPRPRAEAMIAEPAFVHAVERIWSLIRDQAAQALRE